MPKEVYPSIFQIVVPLPDSPLKAVNCYVIKSGDRNLVIDTGMNRPECREAMDKGFRELDLDLSKTDFFITHLHADHMGQASVLAHENSTVYFNKIEADMLSRSHERGGFGKNMGEFAKLAGFSQSELEESFSNHPGLKYHAPQPMDMILKADGDPLVIGDYNFVCVQTPGHSPGHLCLYDREKKFMICGDHVLAEISPNIGAWHHDETPLTDYLVSLDKVYELDVELALPGHRRLLRDFHSRIDELREHHRARLEEVVEVLDGTSMNAYQVTSRMTWSLKYDHWDDVAIMQKWFATGEAISHLRHLVDLGQIKSETRGEHIVYWRD